VVGDPGLQSVAVRVNGFDIEIRRDAQRLMAAFDN
jgi:hypothetical protein